MSVHGKYEAITITSANNMEAMKWKAVAAGGNIAATNDDAMGVLVSQPNSGQHASVAYQGHLKGYAGAAVAAGDPLKVTTSGYLIPVTSGNLVAPIGKAITAGSSGDLFNFIGNFANGAINL